MHTGSLPQSHRTSPVRTWIIRTPFAAKEARQTERGAESLLCRCLEVRSLATHDTLEQRERCELSPKAFRNGDPILKSPEGCHQKATQVPSLTQENAFRVRRYSLENVFAKPPIRGAQKSRRDPQGLRRFFGSLLSSQNQSWTIFGPIHSPK